MKRWNLWVAALLLPTACVVTGVTASPYADELRSADAAGGGGGGGVAGQSGAGGSAGTSGSGGGVPLSACEQGGTPQIVTPVQLTSQDDLTAKTGLSVAQGVGVYAICWAEYSTGGSGLPACAITDAALASLGPTLYFPGVTIWDSPAVAYDSLAGRFLVVWREYSGQALFRGQYITTTGALDGQPFTISQPASAGRPIWLTANGGTFLLSFFSLGVQVPWAFVSNGQAFDSAFLAGAAHRDFFAYGAGFAAIRQTSIYEYDTAGAQTPTYSLTAGSETVGNPTKGMWEGSLDAAAPQDAIAIATEDVSGTFLDRYTMGSGARKSRIKLSSSVTYPLAIAGTWTGAQARFGVLSADTPQIVVDVPQPVSAAKLYFGATHADGSLLSQMAMVVEGTSVRDATLFARGKAFDAFWIELGGSVEQIYMATMACK